MDVGGFRSRLWRYIKATLLHRQGRPLGVVLVAEKSDALRRKVVDTLRARCYETLEASNGAEAVRIGASYLGEIDLLLTDVQLTDFSGWDLAEILRLDHPRLKVLFLSPAERAPVFRLARERALQTPSHTGRTNPPGDRMTGH